MSLVIAKIRTPPRPANILRRPRLVGYLATQVNRQLVIVSAPAGYGKTSLLLDFAHHSGAHIAWYALDEFDNSPHVFLRYLIESIRIHDPSFGSAALHALDTAADTMESLRSVVAPIANELYQLPYSVVIVLDDYHVIHNEVISQLVAMLILYTREHAHVFISSRTVPYIPDQILLLARGQLGGLGADDMKFNVQEIQALFQQNYGLSVPEPRANELAQFCDGWITALLLLGHQLGWAELVKGAVGAPEAATRVFDYLVEQVFAKQPIDLQHFMLGSSVVDRMSPDQLNRLPGLTRAGAYLQALEAQQLFVTRLGGSEDTYSYHPLFRSFLQQRLRSEHAEWHAQLSLAAAEHYSRTQQWERAIETYLSLGREADAGTVLEQAEESLRAFPQILNVKPWLDNLHGSTQFSPHLVSLQAKVHLARGELEQAAEQFKRAAEMFLTAGDRAAAADKLIWRATALRGLGRYQACIDDCATIADLLAGLPSAVGLTALNLSNRGWAFYELGRLKEAQDDFTQARHLLSDSGDFVNQANAAQYLGIVHRALGSTAEALRYYREALGLWDRAERPADAANVLNSLGNLHYLRGEFDEAETVLREALSRSQTTKAMRTQAIVLCTLGDVHKDQREYSKALELFGDGLRVALEAHYAFASTYCQMASADIYRLLGDFVRAHDWLEAASASITASGSATEYARLLLMRGKLARDQGRMDEALASIEEAAGLLHQASDKHLEALAEFLWAQLLDLSGRTDEAAPHLICAAELVEVLGYDQFLVVEGDESASILQHASTLGRVAPTFQRILERVRPFAPRLGAPTASTSSAPVVAVFTLGQERYLVDSGEVTQLRPQVRDVFLFLLARHPRGARPDELWELAWPDLPERRADDILHMTITRIRKALCPVELVNGWYFLAPQRVWYDAREFERGLAGAARAQTARTRIPRLVQALDLYAGDYLTRLDEQWVLVERERLRKVWINAQISLASSYTELQDYESALQVYQRLNVEEPFLEEAWQGAVQTFARMGNRAAALAYYERFESVLLEDLGIEPGAEAQALRSRIVNMVT
ncbi:MAG: tetratricopeptide repeat protein [Chloroflexi bacterium]|nr:tetratricopeptide repeat protein [Chloroflexota bacterium]